MCVCVCVCVCVYIYIYIYIYIPAVVIFIGNCVSSDQIYNPVEKIVLQNIYDVNDCSVIA